MTERDEETGLCLRCDQFQCECENQQSEHAEVIMKPEPPKEQRETLRDIDFYPNPANKNDDRADHGATAHLDADAFTFAQPPPPGPLTVPVPLTRDCAPGQFVSWTNVQGWTFTGVIQEWDNGTALIMWPTIQTPLIAVQA